MRAIEEVDREIVIAKAREAAALGARVTVTGLWAWAEFANKPTAETREALKQSGWVWCNQRRMWAWRGKPCASRQTTSMSYIIEKYGHEEVTG